MTRYLIVSLTLTYCLLTSATSPVAAQEEKHIFWGQYSSGSLQSSDLDGSNASTVVNSPYTPTDIDLDTVNEKLYWVDSSSSAIYRSDFDGSSYETALDLSVPPISLSVDDGGTHLFWVDKPTGCTRNAVTDPFPILPDADCATRLLSHDTSKVSPTLALGGKAFPDLAFAHNTERYLAYDSVNDRVYWMTNQQIFRSNRDGSNVESILRSSVYLTSFAVSPTLNKLCWGTSGDNGVIACSDITGQNRTTLVTSASAQFGPMSLVINSTTQNLYFIDNSSNAQYLPLSGGSPVNIGRLSNDGTDQPHSIVIDEPAGRIYSLASVADGSTYGSEILRWNLDGTGKTSIARVTASGSSWQANGLWINGSDIQWAEGNSSLGQSRVISVSKSGGSTSILFSLLVGNSLRSPIFIPGTPDRLAFLTPASLKSIDLDGTDEAEVIKKFAPRQFAIASASQKLYYAFSNSINRVNLDGSGDETLLSLSYEPTNLTLDEANGYLFHYNFSAASIVRMNLDGSAVTSFSPATSMNTIAVDSVHGYIYWSTNDSSASSIWRASVSDGSTATEIVTSLKFPSIAVDEQGGKLYYLSQDFELSNLYQADLDGTNSIDLGPIGPNESAPLFINDGWIYYGDFEKTLLLTRRSTSLPVTIEQYGSTKGLDFSTPLGLTSLDLNKSNDKIYWVDPEDGKVYSQAIGDMFLLLDELTSDGDVAVDPTLNIVFAGDTAGLYSMNFTGGARQLLAPESSHRISLDLAGNRLFYLSSGSLKLLDLGTLQIQTLETVSHGNAIANLFYNSDDYSVYWSDGYGDSNYGGADPRHPFYADPYPPIQPDLTPENPGAIYRTRLASGLPVTVTIHNPTTALLPFGIAAIGADGPPPTFSITGSVTIDGVPASGQNVNGGTNLGSSATIGNGTYAFTNIAAGTQAALSVTRSGYTFVEATSQPLTFNVNADAVRNFVGTPNRISGHARYANTGAVAVGVLISDGTRSDTTDGTGYYELVAVPNGSYTVAGTRTGYTVTIDGRSNPIVISNNSQTVDFLLSQGSIQPGTYTVNGYVHISGEPVSSQPVAGGSSLGFALTNSGGNYIFANIASGTLANLSVSRSGYSFVEATGEPLQFTVTANEVRNFEGTPNRISGIARFATLGEEPAPGVLVTNGSQTALTNEEGRYELVAVPNGSYTVSGTLGSYRVEVEEGANPVTISNGSQEVNLWVHSEASPVVLAPWNGFLGVTAIVETINTGEEELGIEITLFTMSGNGSTQQPSSIRTTLQPGEQRDFIINDMIGFEEDRYGIVRIRFDNQRYNGRVVYYKPKAGEVIQWRDNDGKQFDYAFVNPFVGPISGTSYASFNTYQPSQNENEARNLTPNWLTLINADEDVARWFIIKKYDEEGKHLAVTNDIGTVRENCEIIEEDLHCKVQPMGRIDVDGGHVFPGPNHVGLLQITPYDEDTKYSANLIRYGMDSIPEIYTTKYSFSLYFQAMAGISKLQAIPVWNVGDAENWVEVSNVSDAPTNVQFSLYDAAGTEVDNWSEKLESLRTKHINVSEKLPSSSSGVIRIQSADGAGIIAQTVVYQRWYDGSLNASLSMQAREPFNRVLYGTYNRFLSMYNWLKIVNLTDEIRSIKLHLDKGAEHTLTLSPYGGLDIPLHDPLYGLEPNDIGSFSLEDTEPGKIFSNIIRVKPSKGRTYDFMLGVEVE